jgi:hypothetical protein
MFSNKLKRPALALAVTAGLLAAIVVYDYEGTA